MNDITYFTFSVMLSSLAKEKECVEYKHLLLTYNLLTII